MQRNSRKETFEDDGRVVADMSSLAPRRPMFLPNTEGLRQSGMEEPPLIADEGETTDSSDARPWESYDPDKETVRAAMKGALGASLLIWLVYAIGLGLFIFLLTRLFKLF